MTVLADAAHRLRRRLLALLGWRTTGVKVLVFDQRGGVLLIRNRYGRQDQWVLPGGGVGRWEAPRGAAIREVREETDCRLADCTAVATFTALGEGRRDTVHLFRATTNDPPRADGVEVAEARFFALDALPTQVSPATMRRLDELAGLREADGSW